MNSGVELIPIFADNYVFLIYNNSDAVLVDPGDATVALQTIRQKNLQLKAVLITHHHNDHIDGLPAIKEKFPDIPVYAPLKNQSQIAATHYVSEGELISIGGLSFQVMELPGHTLGHIAYYEQQHHWLFSGDVVFGLGCGRIFEGSFTQQYESLQKIKGLPDATRIFCTHEYTGTNLKFLKTLGALSMAQKSYEAGLTVPTVPLSLQQERQCNPFLLARDVESFTEIRQQRNSFKAE